MAKTASMYIRIDPQVKADVEAIYARFGMSLTEAINIFLHQSRNVGGLPFDLVFKEVDARAGELEADLINISFSIDDAESRLDDLESRIDDINSSIDEAEARLDAET